MIAAETQQNGTKAMIQAGALIENAYVVADLDAAIESWTRAGGAGPFFVGESAPPAEACLYRGRPAALHTRFAFGVSGAMPIELVQQTNDGPSLFAEVLEGRGPGLHHLKFVTPSRTAEVERLKGLGLEEVMTLSLGGPGSLLSFVDTRASLGAFIEIMDYDRWRPVHEALLKAHQDWDGQTDPVRPWSQLSDYMGG